MGAGRGERVWALEGKVWMPVRIAWALWEGEHVPLGRQGGWGKGSMSTWGKINGDKEESMGTNSGGGWVHGGKDMGNGEGRGEEFGKEAAGKV